MDVAKIAFHPAARRMIQHKVRLTLPRALASDISPNLIVAADITLLIAQTLEQPAGGMPLLTRGRLVFLEDLVDKKQWTKALELVARSVWFEVAKLSGVPVIAPVDVLTARPAGRLTALYEAGQLLAVMV